MLDFSQSIFLQAGKNFSHITDWHLGGCILVAIPGAHRKPVTLSELLYCNHIADVLKKLIEVVIINDASLPS